MSELTPRQLIRKHAEHAASGLWDGPGTRNQNAGVIENAMDSLLDDLDRTPPALSADARRIIEALEAREATLWKCGCTIEASEARECLRIAREAAGSGEVSYRKCKECGRDILVNGIPVAAAADRIIAALERAKEALRLLEMEYEGSARSKLKEVIVILREAVAREAAGRE